jgi:hypothetical protein
MRNTESTCFISVDLLDEGFWEEWPEEERELTSEERKSIYGFILIPSDSEDFIHPYLVASVPYADEDDTFNQIIPFISPEQLLGMIMSNFAGPRELKRRIFLEYF